MSVILLQHLRVEPMASFCTGPSVNFQVDQNTEPYFLEEKIPIIHEDSRKLHQDQTIVPMVNFSDA